MENPTLPTNWLAALSNANHDGTTQQIDDAVDTKPRRVVMMRRGFSTEHRDNSY